jgi:hypothetical protein
VLRPGRNRVQFFAIEITLEFAQSRVIDFAGVVQADTVAALRLIGLPHTQGSTALLALQKVPNAF